MRKLILPAAVVILLGAAAAFLFLKKRTFREVRAAELLPPETVFFAEAPSFSRTLSRWPGTALHDLWREPEIQAFMEQPRAKLPLLQASKDWGRTLAEVRPVQAFLAVPTIEGEIPQVIAGFSFAGSRAAVENAMESPRADFKNAHPAGKAELLTHGNVEIQVFAEKTNVLAESFVDNWYFVANDVDLLRATLDRFQAPAGAAAESLALRPAFREAMAPLPSEPELSGFIQPQPLVQRFGSLMKAAGQGAAAGNSLPSLEKVQGIGLATQIEGANFHDVWFVYAPEPPESAKLGRNALALTTPDTALFISGQLPPDLATDVEASPMVGLIPGVASLTARGIKLGDLLAAFGPEFSLLLDWPKNGMPAPALAFDVRSAAAVRDALEKLTVADESGDKWARIEAQGATVYQSSGPASFLPQLSPSLGVSEKFFTLTFTDHGPAARAQHPAEGAPTLVQTEPYRTATGAVADPTEAFGFLNTSTLLERAYSTMRPVLAMSLAFNPDVAPYIDAGKLPSPETLSRHLGATAYSKVATPKGLLTESKGPVTSNQALLGAVVIYGVAALPMLKQTLQSGALTNGLVPPVPSMPAPGGNPPSVAPPPAITPPAAPAAPAPATPEAPR